MTNHAAEPGDLTPFAPSGAAANAGDVTSRGTLPFSRALEPGYRPFERGVAVPGARREQEAGPRSQVTLDLETEFAAFDLVDEVYSFVTSPHYGKDLTFFTEVIRDKFADWEEKARLYQIDRIDAKEKRETDELPEEGPSSGIIDFRRLGYLGQRHHKEQLRNKLSKKIEERKKRIRTALSLSETDKAKKIKIMQDLRHELHLEEVNDTDLEEMMKAYISEAPKHIFQTIEEATQVYAYLEDVEKTVSLQAGFDMLDRGVRTIEFDLSPQNIDRLEREEVPARHIQALRDLGSRIGVTNIEGLEELIVTFGVGSWEALIWASNVPQFGVLAGPLGFATGVGAMVGTRAAGRRVREWYLSFPDQRPEQRTRFTLDFSRISTPLPDSQDPIRQMYKGRMDETGKFFRDCDDFRVRLAQRLNAHPAELRGWLNLSSRALGELASGLELPHRVALVRKLRQILTSEYGGKGLEDLTPEQEIDVVNRAYDIVAQDMGGEQVKDYIKNASLRRAKGETAEAGRENRLGTQAKDIEDGKKVFHRKEEEKTLDQVKAERDEIERRRDRMQQAEADYKTRYEAYTNTQKTLVDAEVELDEAVRTIGHDLIIEQVFEADGVTPARDARGRLQYRRIPATGEIGLLRTEESENNRAIERLYKQIGFDTKKREYIKDGLADRYKVASQNFAMAQAKVNELQTRRVETRKSIQAERAKGPKANAARISDLNDVLSECDRDEPGLRMDLAAAEIALEPIKDEYTLLNEELTTLRTRQKAILVEIKTAQNTRATKETAWRKAQDSLDRSRHEVAELLRICGYTDAEINDPNFVVPSAQTISDRVKAVQDEFSKKNAEYEDLKTRVQEGRVPKASEQDLEIVKGLRKLVDSGIFSETKFSGLIEAIISGNIKIEDLAKVSNNEGYHLLLKKIFGEDALSLGPEGNYYMVSRLFSKTRLAEAIIETWRIDERATLTGFFAGDEAGLQIYQNAEVMSRDIKGLNAEIMRLETQKPDKWQDQVTKLRIQVTDFERQRNDMLGKLYDTRLATLLSQDRVRTAEVVRKTLNKLYEDAIIGNPFHETLAAVPAGPRTETVATAEGPISITEANKDIVTSELHNRGRIEAEDIGETGVSVEIALTRDNPATGNMDVNIRINRDWLTLERFPDTLRPDMPPELVQLVYGDVYRRKGAIDLLLFTEDIYITITYDTRKDAVNAGFINTELLNLIYGPNPTDRKRNLADIQAATIDLNYLPVEQDSLVGVSPEVLGFFYDLVGNRRRTVGEIDRFINTLPTDRAGAAGTGLYSAEFIDIIYEPGPAGQRRDPGEITEIVISRDHTVITNMAELANLIHSMHVNIRPELETILFNQIAENVSSVQATLRARLLGNRFTQVRVGPFRVDHQNGELLVHYENAASNVRFDMNLRDFIQMTDIHPDAGAYLTANPNAKSGLIARTGVAIIEAMRTIV